MPKEPFLINPQKPKRKKPRGKKHRITVYGTKTYTRGPASPSKRKGIRVNPSGEEVIIVGRNPRRRKRRGTKRRRTYRRRNPVRATARRRVRRSPKRTYRRRRTRRNPVRAVARRRTRRNPVRRVRRRRTRRNPVASSMSMLNFRRPLQSLMKIAPAVISGVAAGIITNQVPARLGLFGWQARLAQVGVAFIGTAGIRMIAPRQKAAAMAFGIVSLVEMTRGILAERVGGVFAGYSDYASLGYGAFPMMADEGMSGYGAFPIMAESGMSGYDSDESNFYE